MTQSIKNKERDFPKSDSKKLVIKGVFWNGIQLIISQSFSFIVKFILAKLLFPEQFGIIGMASVFIGFIQILNDLGIGAALIQKKESELKSSHFHTAFWTGVVWSIGLYIIISVLVGPLAAKFYDQDILKSLVPILSIGILASPINLVHKAQLIKKMDFKKIAIIGNTSVFIAGLVSIILAVNGAGVWALAFNSVAAIIIEMPLYFKATKWKPKFIWNKTSFKDIFGFGIFTTGTNTVNYWMQNFDYLLIGKLFDASALGAYTLAFLLTDIFRMKLMAVINNVMYPLFSTKQNDKESALKYYFKVIFFNCAIAFPIMTFLAVLGKPFILNLFGDKWSESIIPLQILAVSVMFHMMISGNNALIRGMGKPALEFRIQIVKTIIYLPLLVIGIYYYGLIGASLAVLFNKIIAVFFAHYAINIVLDKSIKYGDLLYEIYPPTLGALISGFMVYWANYLGVNYIFCGIILFFIYSLIVYLLRRDKIIALFKDINNNR